MLKSYCHCIQGKYIGATISFEKESQHGAGTLWHHKNHDKWKGGDNKARSPFSIDLIIPASI